MLVGLYLGAIVVANIVVARFGPSALPFSAFLLIPFDLCTRDLLHERWRGRGLVLRMGGLVGAGAALTMLLSPASARVALASTLAFSAAAIVDAGVYGAAHSLRRFWKMNLSNLFSAVTDSLIFPVMAFGSTTFMLSASQSLAKFGGGIFWSLLFVWLLGMREKKAWERKLKDSLTCRAPLNNEGTSCGRAVLPNADVCLDHAIEESNQCSR